MIERDLNDSFPEDAFISWTCPDCGQPQQVMLRFIEAVQCNHCMDTMMQGMDSDWFDLIDPVEREVA